MDALSSPAERLVVGRGEHVLDGFLLSPGSDLGVPIRLDQRPPSLAAGQACYSPQRLGQATFAPGSIRQRATSLRTELEWSLEGAISDLAGVSGSSQFASTT